MNSKTLIKRDKIFSVSSKQFPKKIDKTDHCVRFYQLKELNTIDFFGRKNINEEMEAELTELSEMYSKTDNLVVIEEADVDEAIPIYHKK